ncbi:MAG: NAD-dependent deacylase [Bacteroides sp.]|nr:NAD-dependent deacylase [Bacteroides sp.]MCM1413778.1 NAD-dependent deacylase [Bacteroides sp.]MCM1472203.1 NAD-dependent deacylase [Bacteroides sp.]
MNGSASSSVKKPRLVFLTGAGVSAESGISTFRDSGGLWDKYPVMDVASADGFARNPALVHQFYNTRRRELLGVEPNQAHRDIAFLQRWYDVSVITQNVDNLHERAGSSDVLHLHGELMKVRSIPHPERIYELTPDNLDTDIDSRDSYGDPIRPHIVFFQEAVPNIEPAAEIVSEADVLVIIGTSMAVYPAAGLVYYARRGVPVYYIDPNPAPVPDGITVIKATATEGMKQLLKILVK